MKASKLTPLIVLLFAGILNAAERPNIVIIDEVLPDRSGSEFAAELNGTSPRVDVIFGTSGESICHHQFLKAGANGFIEKPFVSLS